VAAQHEQPRFRPPASRNGCFVLQDAQEGDEVSLFLRVEVQLKYEVEEICGVFEC
jgi:hypothetical protein